jgi:hypothetical protein
MGILDTFDPKRDGWSFENFSTDDMSWDLFRRTYLAINPSKNFAAPMDLLFYEIFKSCASQGNCGGMSMLALALFRFGGYFGFGSPAFFYSGGSAMNPPDGPARTDLYESINIMQGRQFSAPGIRNFVDVVKAGQLNNAEAAFMRIKDGLASGDYHVLSIANSLFGDAAHTVIPYRADDNGATKTLWIWDPNRPYDDYPDHYDFAANRLTISGPTSWSYNQNSSTYLNGQLYQGSNAGWCFAIPTSLIRHKGRNPLSLPFALTQLDYLFMSNTGGVAQIEDDDGRRLFADAAASKPVLEAAPGRRLEGVFPWPWSGGLDGERPADVLIIDRAANASPLTVTTRGTEYRLSHFGGKRFTEVSAHGSASGEDRVRFDPAAGSVDVRTSGSRRRFDVRHARKHGGDQWDSVTVRDVPVTDDSLRVAVPPAAVDLVDVSTGRERRGVSIEFERVRGSRLSGSTLEEQRIPTSGLSAMPEKFTARRK